MKVLSFLLVALATMWLAACSPQNTSKEITRENPPASEASVRTATRPPLEGISVPNQTFTLEASEATELSLENGTTIHIPAGALVDADQQPISGKVDLNYREFHDATDVLLSGIPMRYDSAGQNFVFQTAGMIEIRASQKGEPVFLAEGKEIDLGMTSYVEEDGYNLYQLDESTNNWGYLKTSQAESVMDPGTPSAIDWSQDPEIAADLKLAEESVPAEPFEPKQLAEGATSFDFDVDYSQYPALTPYKGLVWQYAQMEEAGTLNPDQEEWVFGEIWANASVQEHPHMEGIFYFTLRNEKKEAKILVTPVVAEEDYATTQARFAEIRRRQEARSQEILAARERMKIRQQLAQKQARIQRAFSVSSFGIYNCDRLWSRPQEVLAADFRFDEFEIPLDAEILDQVYLVMPEDNAVIPYVRGNGWNSWENMAYAPDTKNVILAFLPGNEVAIFSAADFEKQKPSGKFVFQMKESQVVIESPKDLRNLINAAS
jgi:hypothetical protein